MATKTTKTDAVLKLLGRQQGATVAQLQKATGWQPDCRNKVSPSTVGTVL